MISNKQRDKKNLQIQNYPMIVYKRQGVAMIKKSTNKYENKLNFKLPDDLVQETRVAAIKALLNWPIIAFFEKNYILIWKHKQEYL